MKKGVNKKTGQKYTILDPYQTTVKKSRKRQPKQYQPFEAKVAMARHMKDNPTKSEKLFYDALKKTFPEYTWETQFIMSGYIVDFVCIDLKLIIEVDGKHHYTGQKRKDDEYRTTVLNGLGYHVMRVKNREVNEHVHVLMGRIRSYINYTNFA